MMFLTQHSAWLHFLPTSLWANMNPTVEENDGEFDGIPAPLEHSLRSLDSVIDAIAELASDESILPVNKPPEVVEWNCPYFERLD